MAACKYNYMVGCLILIFVGFCQDFGYEGPEGPSHWADKYANCIGKHQSPIDIVGQNVITRKFPKLIFDGFDKPLDIVSLENNGHTVVLKVIKGGLPELRGGPLEGTYRFSQLHFHWGPNDSLGSENLINHKRFPLELHMVMYKTNYRDFQDALNFKDGLTVLSFLYKATNEDNDFYEQFDQGLLKVQNMSTSTDINNFVSLDDFTTINRNTFFTYEGSLTTPPCSEVVTWIEFIKTIQLSKEQLKAFRSLLSKTGYLTHNYRPVQPVHGRLIYMNSASYCKARLIFTTLTLIQIVLTIIF